MKFILASVACLGSLALVASHGGSHVDCGFPGISRDACEATGQCAYNSGLLDEPSCHYKFAVIGGNCKTSCEAKGGVWDPNAQKGRYSEANWKLHYSCYYPNTARLPLVNGLPHSSTHSGTSGYKIMLCC